EQAQQRFDVGMIAITDVQEAKAAYDLSVAQEITAQNQLAIAKEQLREVTGKFHGSLEPLKDDITLPSPEPADVKKWVDTALKQNYQLIAAQAAVDKAREDVELNRAGHYPKLDAVASYGYSDVSAGLFGGSTTNDTQIGLQFSLPLYQGGGTSSRVQAAVYRLTQAKEALEQQRRSTDRQARSASFQRTTQLRAGPLPVHHQFPAIEAGRRYAHPRRRGSDQPLVRVIAARRIGQF
ncbi:MAG: TolC family protein, partial [Gammaproteobacteria bacterium]